MRFFLTLPFLLFLSQFTQAQSFELPYTGKVKIKNIKIYQDIQTQDLLIGILQKDNYQVIKLDKNLTLQNNQTYSIKKNAEDNPDFNTSTFLIPASQENLLNRRKNAYQSYTNGELVNYFIDESYGHLIYNNLLTNENKFAFNTLITLEKNEFPILLENINDTLHYLTVFKNSNTIRYIQVKHTTLLKDEKKEIDLTNYYKSGVLDASNDKYFADLLPTTYIKESALFSLMALIKPGEFASFDELVGNNHFFFQNGNLSFYNNNSMKKTFRFSLSLKDFSTSCNHILPGESDIAKFENTPIAKKSRTVNDFDITHDIKAVHESINYTTIVKVDKPHVYVLYIHKPSGSLKRVDFFNDDNVTQLSNEKIYPATYFFQPKDTLESSPQKFAKVAGAKLGRMAMMNVELPNGNILSSMILKDDRFTLADFAGILLESATYLIPVGSLGQAFLVGAASSLVTDAFEAASWAASLKNNKMHCRLFDASLNELPYSELPSIPAIQHEMEIIAEFPNIISKDAEKADILLRDNYKIITYYDKETKKLIVKKY